MWWRVCESVVAKASKEECFGFFYAAQQCETRARSLVAPCANKVLPEPPACGNEDKYWAVVEMGPMVVKEEVRVWLCKCLCRWTRKRLWRKKQGHIR